jgi:hypothetical protein
MRNWNYVMLSAWRCLGTPDNEILKETDPKVTALRPDFVAPGIETEMAAGDAFGRGLKQVLSDP